MVIDPVRGPLVRLAFELYATGDTVNHYGTPYTYFFCRRRRNETCDTPHAL